MSEENKTVYKNSPLEMQDVVISPENEFVQPESEVVKEQIVREKKPLLEPLKTNRFFAVRILYHILRSIWIVAMIVGGFIAWIISLLFI